jgi:hypothetical protein
MNSNQLVIGGEWHKLDGNDRDCGLIGLEAIAQSIKVRRTAGIKIGVDSMRKLGLAGAVMRERKQADHGATGLLVALPGQHSSNARA